MSRSVKFSSESERFSCFLAEKNQNDINTFYAYRSFFYLIFKPSKINSHNSPISKLYLKYLSCRSFKLFKKFARNFFEPMKIFFFSFYFLLAAFSIVYFVSLKAFNKIKSQQEKPFLTCFLVLRSRLHTFSVNLSVLKKVPSVGFVP